MKHLALLFAALLATAVTAATALGGHGNSGPPQCGAFGDKLVVNVTYSLTNDFDSGVHGNAWANDTIGRHVQVWQSGSTTFCAVINDNGSFVTFAGDSPGGTGTVSAGIKGQINGGYVTTMFTGTLDPSPTYKTHGNLGTFDLQCTDAYTCPGAHPSFLSYFTGSPAWDYVNWGWTYHTAKNGNWTNASTGNVGDITG